MSKTLDVDAIVKRWREKADKDWHVGHDDVEDGVWSYQHEANGAARARREDADELERLAAAEPREALDKLRAERDYLFDLPLCRRQLPDGTVPGCTEEALNAWFHIAQDALQQVRVLGPNGTYNWKERAERAERELAQAGSEAGVSARVLDEAIGLSVDMLDVDRLRDWARNILTHGHDISEWGSVPFVAGKMQIMATDEDEPLHSGDDERLDCVTSILAGAEELEGGDEVQEIAAGIIEDCHKLDALILATIKRERQSATAPLPHPRRSRNDTE